MRLSWDGRVRSTHDSVDSDHPSRCDQRNGCRSEMEVTDVSNREKCQTQVTESVS